MLLRDIRKVLRTHGALVVHFSGTPRGVGGGQVRPDFPADLQQVALNARTWQVPCSTVSSGHARGKGDLMGSVGLVLRCRRGASLLGVHHEDAGSWYDPVSGVRNLGACVAPTLVSCDYSITARSGHNEWVLTGYEPVALLTDGEMEVWDTPTNFQRQVRPAELDAAFPGLPLLFFYGRQLMEVHPVARRRRIEEFT